MSSLSEAPLQPELVDAEAGFYGHYAWALDALPTTGQVVLRLREELHRLVEVEGTWQRSEVTTNVFLLSSALTDTVDDYLIGPSYDFSQLAGVIPLAGPGVRAAGALLGAWRALRARRLRGLRAWRRGWDGAVIDFLTRVVSRAPDAAELERARRALILRLPDRLPADLAGRQSRIPAAFRTQDLTHLDIVRLGEKFTEAFPDRERAVLVVGLRTAGSYFAPVLRAWLAAEGYRSVHGVTVRPKKGIASWESQTLRRGASGTGVAVVLDEPVNTGGTLSKAVAVLRAAGFPDNRIVVLVPVHPTHRDWSSGHHGLPLARTRVIVLPPEEWDKPTRLEPAAVETRLVEYFERRKYAGAHIVPSDTADRLNAQLARRSDEKFHTRLKRIYEVRLTNDVGVCETRYVLAKSVGWGWLGYHAFLAAERLTQFVPPLLGLRDGILYTEWLPQDDTAPWPPREQVVDGTAAYVAARVRALRLASCSTADLATGSGRKGIELLAGVLSRAWGGKRIAALKRPRIQRELRRLDLPYPTLIDGKMRRGEWIVGPTSLLKTDFEHHGQGKTELNLADPAYDLADAILHLGLSAAEERRLLEGYAERCHDHSLDERLLLAKLMAGTWAMLAALDNLGAPRLGARRQEFNRHYIDAATFLTVHTARWCGRTLGSRPEPPCWSSPLAVLDIDGVLDKQIFGFPSATAAGLRALRLLHDHGIAIAVNTARTLTETKEYCAAYGFVGGVAEYGAAAWDAVTGRERMLIGPEPLAQLAEVRETLGRIPGVFLNDDYRYSLRAYTYEHGTTVPVPTAMIRSVLADLGADRLGFHQTYVDTAVVAREADKGRGLRALLELSGRESLETIAVGDSEADLPMFLVAGRSFAPAHIGCKSTARLLGCRIMPRAFQGGLLAAARAIAHPAARGCERCRAAERWRPRDRGLFWTLLETADAKPLGRLLRAALDPLALQAFAR